MQMWTVVICWLTHYFQNSSFRKGEGDSLVFSWQNNCFVKKLLLFLALLCAPLFTFSSSTERTYGFQECWLLILLDMSLSGKSKLSLLSSGKLLETSESESPVIEVWSVLNLWVVFEICGYLWWMQSFSVP